ncbi:MAG TPA: DUF4258 domain-containing protein [Burkholderiaceae bacterium]|nr:DUF4258 domain-containing protein [Burkholderiaceae bacterium]
MALNKAGYERRIHELARDSASITWTEHAKQQMRRRHITMSVVLDVLQRGIIHKEPEPDIKTGHMKCTIERFCAGRPTAAVVALESESASSCFVVTAFLIGD